MPLIVVFEKRWKSSLVRLMQEHQIYNVSCVSFYWLPLSSICLLAFVCFIARWLWFNYGSCFVVYELWNMHISVSGAEKYEMSIWCFDLDCKKECFVIFHGNIWILVKNASQFTSWFCIFLLKGKWWVDTQVLIDTWEIWVFGVMGLSIGFQGSALKDIERI